MASPYRAVGPQSQTVVGATATTQAMANPGVVPTPKKKFAWGTWLLVGTGAVVLWKLAK